MPITSAVLKTGIYLNERLRLRYIFFPADIASCSFVYMIIEWMSEYYSWHFTKINRHIFTYRQ